MSNARSSAALFVLLCLFAAVAGAQAETRWTVDPKASLAWWQIDPNLNHLWATTCPQEPSWQSGELTAGGWDQPSSYSKKGVGWVSDTIHIPLYPRYAIRFVCTEALVGQIVVQDTVRWSGMRGQVAIRADALVSGETMRDAYARGAILQTTSYPEIRFTIDSLVDVSRQADTLRGTAMGTLSLHGKTNPISAAVQAFPEAGGTRVLARARIPAVSLVTDWGLSRHALGFGVSMSIWKDLFIGVDLLMHLKRTESN
jgi:polyisoprenoid-binding protein YceI